MPKVSIIMPVYNGEKYLEEAIESVLAQTFQSWELWLVDDCSTDASPQIMRKYRNLDPRVHMISNAQNMKLPRTLNAGFRHANGEYLTWTSDDNRYKNTAIETMVRALDAHPRCGLVYCDMNCIYEDGITLTRPPMDIHHFYVEDVIGACFLYRREVLDTVGDYDPDMFLVEDYDYWLRISKKYEILHIFESVYEYRYHKNSLTSTKQQEVAAQCHRLRLRELAYLLERADEGEREVLFLDMWMYSHAVWRLRGQFFPGGHLPRRLEWLEKAAESENKMDPNKKIILFGAGNYGRKALEYFGRERVHCFADNNGALAGKLIDGVSVISFKRLKEIYADYQIVLSASSRIVMDLAQQLEAAGLKHFTIFCDFYRGGRRDSSSKLESQKWE